MGQIERLGLTRVKIKTSLFLYLHPPLDVRFFVLINFFLDNVYPFGLKGKIKTYKT